MNKSFSQLIQAVYQNDKICIDQYINAYHNKDNEMIEISGNTVFLYPFGLCVNFGGYHPSKDFILKIWSVAYAHNFTFENMYVFVTDPAMMTYSSIDQQSHQGTKDLFTRWESRNMA